MAESNRNGTSFGYGEDIPTNGIKRHTARRETFLVSLRPTHYGFTSTQYLSRTAGQRAFLQRRDFR